MPVLEADVRVNHLSKEGFTIVFAFQMYYQERIRKWYRLLIKHNNFLRADVASIARSLCTILEFIIELPLQFIVCKPARYAVSLEIDHSGRNFGD